MRHHPRHHSGLLEGAVTGVIGAAAVALWYLCLDLVFAFPLRTPSVLGQVLLWRIRPPAEVVAWKPVVSYTVVHGLAFVLFGWVMTWLVHAAVRERYFRFALAVLLLFFEFFFLLFAYGMSLDTLSGFPLWTILTANLLSLGLMLWYQVERHPALLRHADTDPLGLEGAP